MALVSSTINCRRVSNLAAAPEKVKATSSPSRLKTAPSITALHRRALSGWRAPPEADRPAHFQKEQHAEK